MKTEISEHQATMIVEGANGFQSAVMCLTSETTEEAVAKAELMPLPTEHIRRDNLLSREAYRRWLIDLATSCVKVLKESAP